PLVAHASPLFAVGENGRTGGKAAVKVDLRASGLDSATLKKTLAGTGTLGLDGAYMQSTGWTGELLQFLGKGDRLEVNPVSVPFTGRDQKVETGELPVEAVGLAMRLGGTTTLEGKLDYGLRVKTQGGGGVMTKLQRFVDKDGYLPLRLSGSLSKPKLKLPDI